MAPGLREPGLITKMHEGATRLLLQGSPKLRNREDKRVGRGSGEPHCSEPTVNQSQNLI